MSPIQEGARRAGDVGFSPLIAKLLLPPRTPNHSRGRLCHTSFNRPPWDCHSPEWHSCAYPRHSGEWRSQVRIAATAAPLFVPHLRGCPEGGGCCASRRTRGSGTDNSFPFVCERIISFGWGRESSVPGLGTTHLRRQNGRGVLYFGVLAGVRLGVRWHGEAGDRNLMLLACCPRAARPFPPMFTCSQSARPVPLFSRGRGVS